MYKYIISKHGQLIFESDLYNTRKEASIDGFGHLDALESINEDAHYSMIIEEVI